MCRFGAAGEVPTVVLGMTGKTGPGGKTSELADFSVIFPRCIVFCYTCIG